MKKCLEVGTENTVSRTYFPHCNNETIVVESPSNNVTTRENKTMEYRNGGRELFSKTEMEKSPVTYERR